MTLYDREEPVGLALEKIIPFFKKHFGEEDNAAAEAAWRQDGSVLRCGIEPLNAESLS